MCRRAILPLILSIYTFILFPIIPALAQELTLPPDSDRLPPVIQHQPSEQAAATGKPMIIKATITDNVAIKEATLYYRPMGNIEYLNINMKAEGNNIYSATIPAVDVIEPGIEYYIQVSDKTGNMVLRGFSFSPLTVMVEPVLPISEPEKETAVVTPVKPIPEPEIESQVVETPPVERHVYKTESGADKAWYKKWWVWPIVGGGAIAVVAVMNRESDEKPQDAPAVNKGAIIFTAPVP